MRRSGTPVVIAIENISFDRDPRARMIAASLGEAGFDVSVVCPRSPDPAARHVVDGVPVRSFPSAAFDRLGLLGHVLEYAWCCSAIGALLIGLRLRERVDVVHMCVPPHLLFVVARALRWLGCRVVVDQHDLMPELFVARYGPNHNSIYRMVLAAERTALQEADIVLVSNDSSARAAVERAGVPPRRVRIVRSGISGEDLKYIRRLGERWTESGLTTVGYIGNIAHQDGVELLIHAARHAADYLGPDAVRFICIGSGSDLRRLRALAREIGVEKLVEFTGRLDHDQALARLSHCDVCVQPDPSNDFNDSSTMIKTLEYMALGKAVVAFDLPETQVVCGDAALYAKSNSPADLAAKIVELARDPMLRRRLGEVGAERVASALTWKHGEPALLDAYTELLPEPAAMRCSGEDIETPTVESSRNAQPARCSQRGEHVHEPRVANPPTFADARPREREGGAFGMHRGAPGTQGTSQVGKRDDASAEFDGEFREGARGIRRDGARQP
jgi:glycosyltransferase involved in cell wall biosynthesis